LPGSGPPCSFARVIRTGTLEAGKSNRRHLVLANGTGYWRTDFIGKPGADVDMPQAFLVEQDADSVILPHFHERDQFQVVVEGSGSLGRHEVRPVSVHYASRHTGYGPITAGPRGLWYFSLRAMTDPGAHFLPEEREKLERGPKLNLLADPVTGGDAPVEELLAPRPDGVAAWALRVPPGTEVSPPVHAGGPRYYVVVSGEMLVGNERLPRFATVFVGGNDASFEARAGGEALTVLALQYPAG
jgi:mannose-6-phosphate isomerase-like protein (cupin superfamily)